jgi:Domain of unknown function (DUF4129)
MSPPKGRPTGRAGWHHRPPMVTKVLLGMQDRTRARAILAALLLAITIAGIRAASPAAGWVPPARGVVLIIGIALEMTLAALLIVVWRRIQRASQLTPGYAGASPASADSASPPADLAARLRVILSRILGLGLIVIPVAIAVAFFRDLPIRHPVKVRLPTSTPVIRRYRAVPPVHLSGWVEILIAILRYGLIIVLIATVVAIAYTAWLRRTPRLLTTGTPDEPAEFPAELVKAVESGRRALAELDDARAAIIGCYLAMETSLAKAGATRRAAETPDELLARAVAGDLVDAAPAGRLTELFYEARFSSHPMPRAKRDEAARALAELAEPLPRERQGPRERAEGGPSASEPKGASQAPGGEREGQ